MINFELILNYFYLISNINKKFNFVKIYFVELISIIIKYVFVSFCKNRSELDTNVGVRPDAKTEFNRTVKRS